VRRADLCVVLKTGSVYMYACFSVCNSVESQRLGALLRWRVFYSVHIARGAFGTHGITGIPHQSNNLRNMRGRWETGVISALEIRTNESREWDAEVGVGTNLWAIMKRYLQVFHSRGRTELKDLWSTVRSLNNGITRLWPSADLRERERTFLLKQVRKVKWA